MHSRSPFLSLRRQNCRQTSLLFFTVHQRGLNSHIQTHVLKPLLPANTQHSYNLRDRSHNYSIHTLTTVISSLDCCTNTLILLLTICIVKLRSVNFILNEYWIGLDCVYSGITCRKCMSAAMCVSRATVE